LPVSPPQQDPNLSDIALEFGELDHDSAHGAAGGETGADPESIRPGASFDNFARPLVAIGEIRFEGTSTLVPRRMRAGSVMQTKTFGLNSWVS
jgi:hypothetical protein